MEKFGFPKKLLKMTQLCVGSSKSRVSVEQNFSDVFIVKDGFKQGDAQLPLHFNIEYLEYGTREAVIRLPVMVFHSNGPNLLLA